MKANLVALTLSVAFVAATIAATIGLQGEASRLRGETRRLFATADAIGVQAKACEEALHAIASEEAGQAETAATLGARLSPALHRLVSRGLAEIHASAISGAAASRHETPLSLLQSKAGKIYFAELLDRPDYARAVAAVERLEIEAAYAPWFRNLDLPAAQRARLTDLLVDREMAKQDILGLESAAATVTQHRVDAAREWRARATKVLGAAALKQFFEYDGTRLLRTGVEQLATRTSYTETPLGTAQAAAVFGALVTALGNNVGSRFWIIPDDAVEQLRGVLAPGQTAVLRQIQQEQRARVEAREAVKGTRPK
jgi:hypothetical protein